MGIPTPPPMPIQNRATEEETINNLVLSDEVVTYDFWNQWLNIFHEKNGEVPYKISIFAFECVLQQGPTCGLACIAMVSSATCKPFTVFQLLHLAREKQFSNCGEIFNTGNMVTLMKLVIGEFCDVEHVIGDLSTRKYEIIEDLLCGRSCYLFAYDSDKNHAPAILNGQHAHWALACGAVASSSDSCYLLCRQGKSRHLGVWLFEDIVKSNKCLHLISNDLAREPNKYILDDISRTLAAQCIKITPHKKFRTIDLLI